ncbi:electron transporter RnfC [Stutzerimonas stutzeri]|uniref:Ion-translocating oxidoreductase complex subunit C n=1 Tax=Stutzerimonas stutzeri TaxID=316 RepID=W8R8C1_STUST|nr:electron transport complex subunit RsxC [Stutzerimonas stutzeri]AHL74572.1 electron transporter RnfC [Stutzerimonas stutzeri]MCQ4329100.1 electron transport complex subunit RsxC [Stutzerimonas stutzeri]
MTSLNVWDIHGGIHPPERKELSNRMSIQQPPLPARLVVPLAQHLGAPAEPCVALGEHVLKGQKIAEATGFVSAPVHAPTSGTISFIGPQPYPHVSGMLSAAIVIDSDGRDEWIELEPQTAYKAIQPSGLLELIRQAGISGLGGAGFPTGVKLTTPPSQHIHTLIINGTECEPYITADDLLMREKAAELVAGIEIIAHLIQPEQVLIGIEDNKPEAIEAVRAAVGERSYVVKVFPTKYPSGGEKQLIQILTGEEVPSGGLPADIGMLCQNVGTCVAVHDAVLLGKPLISRITTLTGEALTRPMNVEVLIGTPVTDLLAFAGLEQNRLNRLIMGGPMMGFTLPSMDVPLIKTTNCLLASTLEELPPPPPALPCIRCGECAEACPASLLPQQLHFFALGQEHEQLKAYNLFDCIECGACAYVCPSSIPLVQYYRAAKGEIRTLEQKQQKAEHSKQRFELRQERLRRAEEQKEADRKARAERAARAKAVQAETSATASQDDPVARVQATKAGLSDEQKKLKIEASMAQVALKKAEKQLAAHATPELESQVAELRQAASAAQKAMDDAILAAPPLPVAPVPASDEAAKKAKIEAAMLRAQIRKLEKLETLDTDQQSELTTLQGQLAKAEQTLAAAQLSASATAPAKPVDDDTLKKAKIEAAMLRAQIRKLEKLETLDADQQSELSKLQSQLATAEQAFAAAQQSAPATAPAKAADDEALKKTKIEAAMLRAQIRKLEKLQTLDTDQQSELSKLQSQLATAEQALAAAQQSAPAAAPTKPASDDVLKKAKIELAMKRAELKKAEKSGAEEAELSRLRDGLASAEQALHDAEANSGKPAPELVRTEKRPVDEQARALKTEVAFARADLRKLERDEASEASAIEAAQVRLSEAERKLQEYTDSLGVDTPQA